MPRRIPKKVVVEVTANRITKYVVDEHGKELASMAMRRVDRSSWRGTRKAVEDEEAFNAIDEEGGLHEMVVDFDDVGIARFLHEIHGDDPKGGE